MTQPPQTAAGLLRYFTDRCPPTLRHRLRPEAVRRLHALFAKLLSMHPPARLVTVIDGYFELLACRKLEEPLVSDFEWRLGDLLRGAWEEEVEAASDW
ncbi:hypothetical protein [Streptomyces sp. NPDC054958]